MSTQTRHEAMIEEKQAAGGQLIFLAPRSLTQPPASNPAADTAPRCMAGRIDRISRYEDYESRRARMDAFLSSEAALFVVNPVDGVLSGLAAYYFGP
jgi:hypothetical protein